MKTKVALIYFGILILGSIITAIIDQSIGISFGGVVMVDQIIHKVIYMLWGVILWSMSKRYFGF